MLFRDFIWDFYERRTFCWAKIPFFLNSLDKNIIFRGSSILLFFVNVNFLNQRIHILKWIFGLRWWDLFTNLSKIYFWEYRISFLYKLIFIRAILARIMWFIIIFWVQSFGHKLEFFFDILLIWMNSLLIIKVTDNLWYTGDAAIIVSSISFIVYICDSMSSCHSIFIFESDNWLVWRK